MQLCSLVSILEWVLYHFDQVLNLILDLIDSFDIIQPLSAVFRLLYLEFEVIPKFVLHGLTHEVEAVDEGERDDQMVNEI